MKKVLMHFMFLFILVVVAPVMAMPATKIPFTAEASFIPGNISIGKGWITQGGIQQVKGAISEGNVTGDISGTVLLVSYETLDRNTGEGADHGKFVLTVNGGTFEGSFRGTVTDYYSVSGTFVGQGTAMYEGQKIMGSMKGNLTIVDTIPVVVMVLEGIILRPKG